MIYFRKPGHSVGWIVFKKILIAAISPFFSGDLPVLDNDAERAAFAVSRLVRDILEIRGDALFEYAVFRANRVKDPSIAGRDIVVRQQSTRSTAVTV